MSQQDRTLDRYQELMQINAASHIVRAARQLGIFDALRGGQKTADQLAESLGLSRPGLDLMLDCLISMSVVERYQDDHALAPVMQLLCQYDADLGDSGWQRLAATVRRGDAARAETAVSDAAAESTSDQPQAGTSDASREHRSAQREYLDGQAATQWVHTPAAMQVAEMLGIGLDLAASDVPVDPASGTPAAAGEASAGATGPEPAASPRRLRILDLGCGSAVWSCAIAYRDESSTVLAVDAAPALAAARSTAESIQLGHRFETMDGDPESASLPESNFDLVLIAQRLHAASPTGRQRLLDQATAALVPGGRLVLVDLFEGPARPRLAETIEALRIYLATPQGDVLSADGLQQQLRQRDFQDIRFSFIAASRINLGVMVAQ